MRGKSWEKTHVIWTDSLASGLNGGRFGNKCSYQQLAAPINWLLHIMAETYCFFSKYFHRELSSPKQRIVCSSRYLIIYHGVIAVVFVIPCISWIRIYNTLCSNHFFLFITTTYKSFQQLQQIYVCNSTRLFLHEPSSLLRKPFLSVKTPQSYHSHFTTHTFLSLLSCCTLFVFLS